MDAAPHKLITCILPFGVAMPLLRALKTKKGIVSANINNARGAGRLSVVADRKLGDETEKQVFTVVVPPDRADEIFEFIYVEAEIDRPHGGLMYMGKLHHASTFTLPDLPDEE